MYPSPLQVGSSKQLFFDHRFIERAENVSLRVNPPVKKESVLPAHEPWDCCGASLRIIQEGTLVRAWYTTHMHGDGMKAGLLCYAESTDGIHFEKPRIGAVEWQGSKENNIVFPHVFDASPFIDPNAPAAERWKLPWCYGYPALPREITDPDLIGTYMATSPDGLHWTPRPERVLPFVAEMHKLVYWEPALRKYVIFLRALNAKDPTRRRAIARIDTENIDQPWPYEKGWPRIPPKNMQVLSSDDVPLVFQADDQDPPNTDVYAASPQRYPWAADAWVMFPSLYRHTPPPVGTDGNDGPISTQFACSRDGRAWSRPERVPYVRPGLSTEFDRGYTMVGAGMARFGDKLYQYYGAKGGTHHGRTDDLPEGERAKVARNACVRLEQRLDGFVSADAAYTGGSLTTPSIVFEGNQLELNIDSESVGSARMEIQDAQGRPMDGFSLADCDEIGGNYIRKKVTWKGSANVGALAGRTVRLHFAMRGAKLYAFQFSASSPPEGTLP